MIKVLLPKIIGACQYHRCLLPYQNKSGIELFYDDLQANTGDIVISHYSNIDSETILKLQFNGIKVILDIDDWWQLPFTHIAYKQSLLYESDIIECIKEADYITTTTEILAEKIRVLNPNCEVFPNALNADLCKIENIQNKKFRIGYMGGNTHIYDVKLLSGMYKKLLPYKDKIEFVIFGFPHSKTGKEYDIFRAYVNTISGHRELRIYKEKTSDVFNYLDLYNKCDMFIAPLVNDEFNRCKSELKIVEAGWFYKVIASSDMSAYNKVIEHKKTGYLCKNANDFAKAIIYQFENRLTVGENLYEFVNQNFNLDTIRQKRFEFLEL